MNTARPTTKTRRRPSRSLRRAPSSSRPPNTRVYASWTHDSPATPRCIATAMDGSPVKITELSRRIRK